LQSAFPEKLLVFAIENSTVKNRGRRYSDARRAKKDCCSLAAGQATI
jgi:hypothetical protein